MELEAEEALKQFQVDHAVQDELYFHDHELQRTVLKESKWKQDPLYFTKIRVSIIALLKILLHAKSGGALEVMGSLMGRVLGNEMIIMDAFELPVEGTETRVSAQNEGYEYMSQYINHSEQVGRQENAIGWYHSHPGYGCWLSGIDVGTQKLNQLYSEPFVALVVDPNRTSSSGKVEIGAFRTYPEGYTPKIDSNEKTSVPLAKIEDFGVHAKSYYQLELSFFKSSTDTLILNSLWKRYWNWPFLTSQIDDLAEKIKRATGEIGSMAPFERKGDLKEDSPLTKIVSEGKNVSTEAQHALISKVLQDRIFNKAFIF